MEKQGRRQTSPYYVQMVVVMLWYNSHILYVNVIVIRTNISVVVVIGAEDSYCYCEYWL